jgi:hypothetical protein
MTSVLALMTHMTGFFLRRFLVACQRTQRPAGAVSAYSKIVFLNSPGMSNSEDIMILRADMVGWEVGRRRYGAAEGGPRFYAEKEAKLRSCYIKRKQNQALELVNERRMIRDQPGLCSRGVNGVWLPVYEYPMDDSTRAAIAQQKSTSVLNIDSFTLTRRYVYKPKRLFIRNHMSLGLRVLPVHK